MTKETRGRKPKERMKDAKVSRTISVRPSVEKAIKKAHKMTLTAYFEANVIQDEPVQELINQNNHISKQK